MEKDDIKLKIASKGNEKKVEMVKALESLKELAEYSLEWHKTIAQIYKFRYDGFIEVGFTSEQALEIIKTRGIEA